MSSVTSNFVLQSFVELYKFFIIYVLYFLVSFPYKKICTHLMDIYIYYIIIFVGVCILYDITITQSLGILSHFVLSKIPRSSVLSI